MESKYILIGELHGTKESPEACFEILKKHKVKQLALEFQKKEQCEIDDYFKGKKRVEELSIFQREDNHDGRASKAIMDLIKKAKAKDIKILLVDDWSDITRRDEAMANNLKLIKGPVAYYCGEVHASKKSISFPEFNGKSQKINTCGSFLPEKETISYRIVSIEGGKHYNFKIKNVKKQEKLRKHIKDLPLIVPSKEGGFDFFYIVKKFTESQ
jgi:hypothetical protein